MQLFWMKGFKVRRYSLDDDEKKHVLRLNITNVILRPTLFSIIIDALKSERPVVLIRH